MDQCRDIPGVTVHDTHRLGGGYGDFNIGFKGHTLIVECKTDKGKLNENEKEFEFSWTGSYLIARNMDPILEWINFINTQCPNATDFLASISDHKD